MLTDNELDAKLEQSPAPRVTIDRIHGVIGNKTFYNHGLLTICVLDLVNGFTVTGESACASPENYNQEIGEKIAFDNAVNKIWALEGYLLKQWIFEGAHFGQQISAHPAGVIVMNNALESDFRGDK